MKFTPEGGSIADPHPQRGRATAGDRLVVEVADTGIGIEPEVLPRIFDPFQQGETTITRKFGGLGLGLAISRGIVEAHGGHAVAESGGKGRGATFRVVLKALPEPAVEGDGEPVGGRPERRAGTGPRRSHPGGGGRAGDAAADGEAAAGPRPRGDDGGHHRLGAARRSRRASST